MFWTKLIFNAAVAAATAFLSSVLKDLSAGFPQSAS